MAKGVKKQASKKQNSVASSPKNAVSENNIKSENRDINYRDSNNSDSNPLSIWLTNQNLMEAVIYSEILGKPKCKRRDRCR